LGQYCKQCRMCARDVRVWKSEREREGDRESVCVCVWVRGGGVSGSKVIKVIKVWSYGFAARGASVEF